MHLKREDSLHERKSRKGKAVQSSVTRLKFWWEVDTTLQPMGHKDSCSNKQIKLISIRLFFID